MIEIDFTTAIFIYLLIPLMFLLISWFYYEIWRNVLNFNKQKKHVFQCTICAHSYIISANISMSRCPRCESIHDVNI